MLRFRNHVHIKRPVDEVFRQISDLEKIPMWNYYVRKVERLSRPGPVVRGTQYRQVRKSDEQILNIDEIVHNKRVVISTSPESSPRFTREMALTQTNVNGSEATELVDTWKLDLAIPGVIEAILKSKVRTAIAENLHKLKELLEHQGVRLQDGRQVTL